MKCEFTEAGSLRVIAENGAEWMAIKSWNQSDVQIISPSEDRKDRNCKSTSDMITNIRNSMPS